MRLEQSDQDLIYCVSLVEQLLTTGGGWQDQCGCLRGGFKISRSCGTLPMVVTKTVLPVPPKFIDLFEKHTFLVYTGVPRLARDTLMNALKRHSAQPGGCDLVMGALVREAEAAAASLAGLCNGSISGGIIGSGSSDEAENNLAALSSLGNTLSRYWQLKTYMAPGSEPPHIADLLQALRPLCCGLGVCGAGAGGFAVAILRPDAFIEECKVGGKDIFTCFAETLKAVSPVLSAHRIAVDMEGSHVK
jgi:fucokinase